MLVFVEHDEDGNVFHVCEVHTTEGREVEQIRPGMTEKQKKDRANAVDAAIKIRENETKQSLNALKAQGKRLIVLSDTEAALPDIRDLDRYKVANEKLSRRTDAEVEALRAARANSTP